MYQLNRRRFIHGMVGGTVSALAVLPPAFAASQPALDIIATTAMIADAVRKVGGAYVRVTPLMGEGVDPHTFRQTRSDIAAMLRADTVFWHGLYLEAQLEKFLLALSEKKTVIPIAERAIPLEKRIAHETYHDRFDPHVWMDPRLWVLILAEIAEELGKLIPDQVESFQRNAKEYEDEISKLAAYAEEVLASVPENNRVLVTAHDAFNYFGRAYDFEVLGIQGLSTESEAGLARIENLVDTLVERKIGAIFVESSVSDRNVKALIEGAAAQGHSVVIAGELFSDAMGKPGTYEGTYLGMIDHNVTLIARALGGEAPPAGFSGRLSTIN